MNQLNSLRASVLSLILLTSSISLFAQNFMQEGKLLVKTDGTEIPFSSVDFEEGMVSYVFKGKFYSMDNDEGTFPINELAYFYQKNRDTYSKTKASKQFYPLEMAGIKDIYVHKVETARLNGSTGYITFIYIGDDESTDLIFDDGVNQKKYKPQLIKHLEVDPNYHSLVSDENFKFTKKNLIKTLTDFSYDNPIQAPEGSKNGKLVLYGRKVDIKKGCKLELNGKTYDLNENFRSTLEFPVFNSVPLKVNGNKHLLMTHPHETRYYRLIKWSDGLCRPELTSLKEAFSLVRTLPVKEL